MSALRRLWAKRNDDVRLTKGLAATLGFLVSVPLSIAIILGALAMVQVADEAGDRARADRRSRGDIERIVERVVRVEGVRDLARALERACRQFESCAAELDRAERRERRARRDRTERRRRPDRESDRAPRQRADRPPRQPTLPTHEPDPVGGPGPPDPPGTSTPSTPQSSPAVPGPQRPSVPSPPDVEPVVQVDAPPVDLDGDQGLLPQLLPRVNVTPVDVPPIRLP